MNNVYACDTKYSLKIKDAQRLDTILRLSNIGSQLNFCKKGQKADIFKVQS